MSLLSGKIGIPEGAYTLLSDETPLSPSLLNDIKDATEFVEKYKEIITEIIDNPPGAGTAIYWGHINSDGTIASDDGVASVSRVAEGIYDVTMDHSFSSDGASGWQGAAVVSPESTPTEEGTATTKEYLGLHTVSVDVNDSAVQYDSQTGQIWANDENSQALGIAASGFPYVSPDTTGSDRIAVYKIDTDTWRYIYLPDLWEINILQNGEPLMLNVPERVAYVQAGGTSGSAKAGFRTTLIYDLDTLELIQNTHDDIYSGTGQCVIVGWDNTNDRIITNDGTRTAMWSMADGMLDTLIDSDPSAYSVNKRLLCDNNGKFWFPEGSHPKDWRRWYIVSSTLTTDTVDAGTDGIAATPDVYCFDSTNNEIYYLDNGHTILKKIDCDSPNTVTSIHTYSALTGGNHNTEISEATAMEMSSDNSRLLIVRGTASTYECFFVVDPADGSIDFHFDNPANTLTSNWDTQNIAVGQGKVWTLGSKRIQEIGFTGGEIDTALEIYDPVFHAVRFTAANKVRVQFYKGNNFRVRQDSAFHIHITGTAV